MRKVFILLFALLVVITLFIGLNNSHNNESEIWRSIDHVEWDNNDSDSFPGSGMYFFEENNKKYCVFMLYGSGVYVMAHHQSEVTIINNQEIEIEIPNHFIHLAESIMRIDKHRVRLEQGNLIMDKKIYKASQTPNNYKHILK